MDIAILLVLILFNGLFAMSEIALVASRRGRLQPKADAGDRGAAAAIELGEEPTRFLSTIQIGITSIGIMSGILGEALLSKRLAAWMEGAGLSADASDYVATGFVVVAITYVSIVLGELVPKRLGQMNPEAVARIVARPIKWLSIASKPFVKLLSGSTHVVLSCLGLRKAVAGDAVREEVDALVDELRVLVDDGGRHARRKHESILLNLFDLENLTVDDTMTPRGQIEAIDLEDDIDDIRNALATAHHTRLVVCEGGLDNVVGILHVRKVLNATRRDPIGLAGLREILREPYFVPEGTPLLDQLTRFQENQRHVGLVVDEYGEILGLVTLKDILEEIVGEFTSAAIGSAALFHKEADGTVIADGACSLRVLNRKAGFAFPLEGPKTINGLLLEQLEDIPEGGTTLNIAGHTVEIMQVQDRMVKVVRIQPPPARPAHAQEAA